MKFLLVANWKMNPETKKEAKNLFDLIKKGLKNVKNTEVVICAPFPFISILNPRPKILKLGAQNCFWEKSGPFTGEISTLMLKDLNCQYVILGHSERRRYLGETDEMINKKLKAALKANLKPILCIGETEQEKRAGKTKKVLISQLKNAFNRLATKWLSRLIIAYEPVWAIGTGNPCGLEEAKRIYLFLRNLFQDKNSPHSIPILYGGGVDSENAKDYINIGFNGLLVGGVSLNIQEFARVVQSIDKI